MTQGRIRIMNTKFFKKLGTRLFTLPLVVSVCLSIAGAAVLHHVGNNYLMQEVYKPHAINILSEKKYYVDAWLERCKRQSEDISYNRIIRENVVNLIGVQSQSNKSTQKKGDVSTVARQNITRFLKDFVAADNYAIIAILSLTGTVISSTQEEVIGEDWSDKDFLKDALSGLDKTIIKGVHQSGDSVYRIVCLSPVRDAGQKVIAVGYYVASADKLINYLKIAEPVYRTEKVILVTKEGSTLIAENGAETEKMGETLSMNVSDSPMIRHNGVLFSRTDLNQTPWTLVSAVRWSEVSWPLSVMMIFYCSFACAMILIIVVQGTYVVSRLLRKPIERLIGEIQSMAAGHPVEGFGKGFKGELSDLIDALNTMMHASREREAQIINEIAELKRNQGFSMEDKNVSEKSRLSAAFLERASSELRDICKALSADVEQILHGNDRSQAFDRKKLLSLSRDSGKKLRVIDSLFGLLNFVGTPQGMKSEESYLCELLGEVEKTAQSIAGLKEICLVIECDDRFRDRTVNVERVRLKQIINYLVGYCLDSIDIGTVTVLASLLSLEGKEHIEIFIANAQGDGGLENQGGLLETDGHALESLGIDVVKEAIWSLGGQIEVEKLAGKGFLSTVTIPLQSEP